MNILVIAILLALLILGLYVLYTNNKSNSIITALPAGTQQGGDYYYPGIYQQQPWKFSWYDLMTYPQFSNEGHSRDYTNNWGVGGPATWS